MLGFGMIVDGLRVGVDLFVWCGVGVGVSCVSGGGRVLVFVRFGVCVKGRLLDVGFWRVFVLKLVVEGRVLWLEGRAVWLGVVVCGSEFGGFESGWGFVVVWEVCCGLIACGLCWFGRGVVRVL